MGVNDVVDLHARRKNIEDDGIAYCDDPRSQLFSPDKLIMARFFGEKIALHSDKSSFMSFHGADKMAPNIVIEKLAMNKVNVFALVEYHLSV
jgi:hypothetical protein